MLKIQEIIKLLKKDYITIYIKKQWAPWNISFTLYFKGLFCHLTTKNTCASSNRKHDKDNRKDNLAYDKEKPQANEKYENPCNETETST